jgi:hypothetical protein
MKIPTCPPTESPRHRPAVVAVALLGAVLVLSGCVSPRYLEARKDTPPPEMINMLFAPSRLEANLNFVITYNGPGSWKRDAFWDEYVVTVHNPGSQVLTVSAAGLTDYAGTVRVPGDDPWALEKLSKTLEQRYRAAGIAFVRYTAPGVIIVGTGVAVIGATGVFSSGAASVAAVTILAVPVYYVAVLTINHYNKVAMEKEYNRRRFVLPLALAPGETRTGSFFFPMVPSPRSLALHWEDPSGPGDAVLSLDFLKGLHVKKAAKSLRAE